MKIRIDYMVAGAKSSMYTKASRRDIMPGVRLITSLSEETGDRRIEGHQIEAIISYSEEARESVTQLINV